MKKNIIITIILLHYCSLTMTDNIVSISINLWNQKALELGLNSFRITPLKMVAAGVVGCVGGAYGLQRYCPWLNTTGHTIFKRLKSWFLPTTSFSGSSIQQTPSTTDTAQDTTQQSPPSYDDIQPLSAANFNEQNDQQKPLPSAPSFDLMNQPLRPKRTANPFLVLFGRQENIQGTMMEISLQDQPSDLFFSVNRNQYNIDIQPIQSFQLKDKSGDPIKECIAIQDGYVLVNVTTLMNNIQKNKNPEIWLKMYAIVESCLRTLENKNRVLEQNPGEEDNNALLVQPDDEQWSADEYWNQNEYTQKIKELNGFLTLYKPFKEHNDKAVELVSFLKKKNNNNEILNILLKTARQHHHLKLIPDTIQYILSVARQDSHYTFIDEIPNLDNNFIQELFNMVAIKLPWHELIETILRSCDPKKELFWQFLEIIFSKHNKLWEHYRSLLEDHKPQYIEEDLKSQDKGQLLSIIKKIKTHTAAINFVKDQLQKNQRSEHFRLILSTATTYQLPDAITILEEAEVNDRPKPASSPDSKILSVHQHQTLGEILLDAVERDLVTLIPAIALSYDHSEETFFDIQKRFFQGKHQDILTHIRLKRSIYLKQDMPADRLLQISIMIQQQHQENDQYTTPFLNTLKTTIYQLLNPSPSLIITQQGQCIGQYGQIITIFNNAIQKNNQDLIKIIMLSIDENSDMFWELMGLLVHDSWSFISQDNDLTKFFVQNTKKSLSQAESIGAIQETRKTIRMKTELVNFIKQQKHANINDHKKINEINTTLSLLLPHAQANSKFHYVINALHKAGITIPLQDTVSKPNDTFIKALLNHAIKTQWTDLISVIILSCNPNEDLLWELATIVAQHQSTLWQDLTPTLDNVIALYLPNNQEKNATQENLIKRIGIIKEKIKAINAEVVFIQTALQKSAQAGSLSTQNAVNMLFDKATQHSLHDVTRMLKSANTNITPNNALIIGKSDFIRNLLSMAIEKKYIALITTILFSCEANYSEFWDVAEIVAGNNNLWQTILPIIQQSTSIYLPDNFNPETKTQLLQEIKKIQDKIRQRKDMVSNIQRYQDNDVLATLLHHAQNNNLTEAKVILKCTNEKIESQDRIIIGTDNFINNIIDTAITYNNISLIKTILLSCDPTKPVFLDLLKKVLNYSTVWKDIEPIILQIYKRYSPTQLNIQCEQQCDTMVANIQKRAIFQTLIDNMATMINIQSGGYYNLWRAISLKKRDELSLLFDTNGKIDKIDDAIFDSIVDNFLGAVNIYLSNQQSIWIQSNTYYPIIETSMNKYYAARVEAKNALYREYMSTTKQINESRQQHQHTNPNGDYQPWTN